MDERVRIALRTARCRGAPCQRDGHPGRAARRILKQQPDKANEVLSQIEASSRQAVPNCSACWDFYARDNQVDDIAPQTQSAATGRAG